MKTAMFLSHIDRVMEQGGAKNMAEGLQKLIPYGLECVDINGANIGRRYDFNELKQALTDNGIEVSSLFYLAPFDWKDKNIISSFKEETKRQLEYCASLGTDIFMPVPNIPTNHADEFERTECQKKLIEYLNEAVLMCKEYNISPVMENYSDHRNPYSKVTDFDIIFENTPGLGYVLDTGNFWFSDTDFIDVYEKFHSITKHVHLKDITPNENGYLKINGRNADGHDVGSGILDFEKLFERLNHYGYDGAVSIEICNADDMMNKLIRSFEYVKKLRSGIGA